MCGIAGFWQTRRLAEPPLDVLERMGRTLAHRGPDDCGTFYDDSSGVGLAFRRLSIIDLSPEGRQPMVSASGRYRVVFNGEVYNFQEIRAELGKQLWHGHSDTEVMLAAIERWGLGAAVARFVGMFAFALWDHHEQKLYLVRDRLGIKPLYYGYTGGNFVFASELKAIREFPGFDSTIDRNALALYMRFTCVPTPHSIYQGIHKLPQGHILCLDCDLQPDIRPFWSALEIAQDGICNPLKINDEEAVGQLQEKLLKAVRLRMVADVPLGAFLSGGIDSSTVVALMQSQSSRPVKTFSIGFHENSYNEAVYARKVADHLGTDHTELYVTAKDALDLVPQLAPMYDEPFADSSQIPTHIVSRLARQQVTVSLSGDGGDELFGGYSRYPFIDSVWNKVDKIPHFLGHIMARLIHSLPPGPVDGLFRHLPLPDRLKEGAPDKLNAFANFLSRGTPDEIYLYAMSHWREPARVVIGSQEPDTQLKTLAELKTLPTSTEMAMLADLLFYLPDDILVKVDRASMAVSLEVRVPLLDHGVVEFAWKLPLHFKIRNGKAKWILRQLLYRYVPPEIVERPKMGFGVPIGEWLRGPLREWSEDLLSHESMTSSGFLNPDPIREKWKEHLSGTRNWEYPLWNALMFQDWLSTSKRTIVAPQVAGTRLL
jgi:asparagine synthase (glutamine-hydrolysing)